MSPYGSVFVATATIIARRRGEVKKIFHSIIAEPTGGVKENAPRRRRSAFHAAKGGNSRREASIHANAVRNSRRRRRQFIQKRPRRGVICEVVAPPGREEETEGSRNFALWANIRSPFAWQTSLPISGRRMRTGFRSARSAGGARPDGGVGPPKNESTPEWGAFVLEAPPGIGPGMKVLQTSALPLGYGAGWGKVTGDAGL